MQQELRDQEREEEDVDDDVLVVENRPLQCYTKSTALNLGLNNSNNTDNVEMNANLTENYSNTDLGAATGTGSNLDEMRLNINGIGLGKYAFQLIGPLSMYLGKVVGNEKILGSGYNNSSNLGTHDGRGDLNVPPSTSSWALFRSASSFYHENSTGNGVNGDPTSRGLSSSLPTATTSGSASSDIILSNVHGNLVFQNNTNTNNTGNEINDNRPNVIHFNNNRPRRRNRNTLSSKAVSLVSFPSSYSDDISTILRLQIIFLIFLLLDVIISYSCTEYNVSMASDIRVKDTLLSTQSPNQLPSAFLFPATNYSEVYYSKIYFLGIFLDIWGFLTVFTKWKFGILSFILLEGLFILLTLPISPYPMFSCKYFINFGMVLFAFSFYKRLILTWASTSNHRFVRI